MWNDVNRTLAAAAAIIPHDAVPCVLCRSNAGQGSP
jgi:hypothetical protein